MDKTFKEHKITINLFDASQQIKYLFNIKSNIVWT